MFWPVALTILPFSLVAVAAPVVLDNKNNLTNVFTAAEQSFDPKLLETFIYYSEFSAAAYCSPQQGQIGGSVKCGSSATCPLVEKSETKIHSAWIGLGDSAATGYVASDLTKKNIVLAMRGSVGLYNWVADAKYFLTPCSEIVEGAMCDTGFLGFWTDSKNKAMEGIEAALKENPNWPIIVTGHSLGGAAGVYAAADLRKKYLDVTLYTYGQPRAGNLELSRFITSQGKNYRVTHTSDAVPKLPPESAPFAGGSYAHISPEYWISDGLGNNPENVKVLEGYSNTEGNTGTGHLKFNIVAHIQYFQPNMYSCVLPIPLPLGPIGYGKGTYAVEGYDHAMTVEEVREKVGNNTIWTKEVTIAME